ncbi:YcaO-like family protein [Micromonospora sp. NBC_01813]|uniref:YcaO-like family protein n=1 Tax=Micromonospora sp. NBC_01813 TaxID=2975988 RepID=UPI002DD958C0|nr:YcaO-like family protein [Micromonospora sp. NBC_01813]WSA10782.1 YcaO-like family protein [Micromonospora sp. NBC_01813]
MTGQRAAVPGGLVDARTGVIRRVEPYPRHPHLPAALHLVRSVISDTTAFCAWRSDPSGMGAALWDPTAAEGAAVGEAVERYCGNLVPPDLPVATWTQLTADGDDAVDPQTLPLYDVDQYAAAGFPFVPFTRDTPAEWVRGQRLPTGEPVWVPAALVWTSYRYRDLPAVTATAYAGIGAGTTTDAAVASALSELVERDAMTLTWTARLVGARLPTPAWLRGPATGATGALRTRLCRFPSELGLPVLGALVHDTVDDYVTLGTACHPDPDTAAAKALAEALHVQMVMRDLDDPHGAFAAVAAAPGSPLKPWRADRTYLRDYRTDWHDATDPGCHLQAYLDPELAHGLIDAVDSWPLADTSTRPAHPAEPARPSRSAGPVAPAQADPGAARRVRLLVDQVQAHGFDAVAVDVTTPDVRWAGLHVVRAVVPGLYSNAAAAFPLLGGARLARLLQGRGQPRLTPLPH